MNSLNKKNIVNGDISYTIRTVDDTCTDYSIDFELFVFALKTNKVNVVFQYRTALSSEWKSNADLSFPEGQRIENNLLTGIPCSLEGEKTVFKWQFSSNGIAQGQACEIRLFIYPMVSVISSLNAHHWLERVYPDVYREIDQNRQNNIVDIDIDGNFLGITSNSVYMLNPDTGQKKNEITGLVNPVFFYVKKDGNYIILHTSGSSISEYTAAGALVYTFSNTAYLLAANQFFYDEKTENILVASPQTHYVLEINWSLDTRGTIAWAHGQGLVGFGLNRLNSPAYCIYDYDSRNKVYIADTENNRILVVDRIRDQKHEITGTTVEEKQITLSKPIYVISIENEIIVIEKSGIGAVYDEDPEVHTSLLRYRASQQPSITSGQDAVSKYSNMLYVPVTRSIF